MSVKGKRDYRPVLHFTPEKGWINDPNGLIYDGERYHMFAQYYPDDTKWGPMHWLHAVSDDLVTWKELPAALEPDKNGMCFSGSAIMHNGHPALMYTSHGEFEQQSVAFTENGTDFVPYAGNPVIKNDTLRDFRDPKLFFNSKYNKYGVSVAAGDHVDFYISDDLINWTKTGEFSDQVHAPGVHECPDMVDMKLDDSTVCTVMIASMQLNSKVSCTQYLIGKFDGDRFELTEPFGKPVYIDKGWDNYAAVSFWGTDEPVFIGWANNWHYADRLPQGEYAGMMTLPRKAFIKRTPAGIRLGFAPVKQVEQRFGEGEFIDGGCELTDEVFRLKIKGKEPYVTLSNLAGDCLTMRRFNGKFILDRRHAGETGKADELSTDAYGLSETPVLLEDDDEMEIIFDRSVIEVYADGGLYTATALAFPVQPYELLSVSGAEAEISYLEI